VTAATGLLGLAAIAVGEWIVGVPVEQRGMIVPPAHRAGFIILTFSGLFMLMTVAMFIGGLLEGAWRGHTVVTNTEPVPPHEPPPRASVPDVSGDRTLDSLPARGSGGGR
jgi:hypothetical protein